MKKQIKAEIVADSISPQGNRITTFLLTYPRIIHAELMTHRLFSRNSASSRAIPFEKMVKMVKEDPFIPIAWQKDHKGMQGTEYFTNENMFIWDSDKRINKNGVLFIDSFKEDWLDARDSVIKYAKNLYNGRRQSENHEYYKNSKLTKQLCNRLLEPFMWHTVLVTATEWDNFFELRCPQYGGTDVKNNEVYFKSKKEAIKHLQEIGVNTVNLKEDDILGWLQINKSQAEIHIQALAESMWDVMNESTPKKLQPGEWHIPFGDKISSNVTDWFLDIKDQAYWLGKDMTPLFLKVATARCARLSYMTFDGEIDYQKDIGLHDKLLQDKHMSPFEHCARAMSDDEYSEFYKGEVSPMDLYCLGRCRFTTNSGWCNNFKGFIQYRYMIENNYN